LIDAYQRSPEWLHLTAGTKTMYGIYLRPFVPVGHIPVAQVQRRDLMTMRDAIASERGNGAAMGFVRAAASLFSWAVDREWIDFTPARKMAKGLPRGHLRAWTEAEAATAIAKLPEALRRVVVLALYTGQRRGDLCTLPWSAYDGQAIRLTQLKTSEPLVIPCHPALKAELDAWRTGDVIAIGASTILKDHRGRPWKPNLLSHYLPEALTRVGLTNEINIHGIRKLAATNLAEAGCSTHEIAAITGHRTLAMVALYTRSVDQKRLADAAIIRLSKRNTNLQNP
jgi:integrase